MVEKREGPLETHGGVQNAHSRTGSNKRAHTFASLLRAVSMIQESPSPRPLAPSARDSPSIPVFSSPELTSSGSVSTASASSARSTTTISSTMPYDPKIWAGKRLGSHVVLSGLRTCAPHTVASAFSSTTFPGMLHQQAQQQQDRATPVATTSSQIFPYNLPFGASIKKIHMQDSSLPFPSSTSLSSDLSAQPLPPTSKGLLRAMESGQSQTAIVAHMKGTTEAAAPLRYYKKIKISCLDHAGAASVAMTASLPSATVAISRAHTAATLKGLAVPAGALYNGDGTGGHRIGEVAWKAGTITCESHHHQATALSKRRAPRTDLSKLTADELERRKRAQARQYSASARRRQVDREQDLRDQVKTLSIFQVLTEAAPDAVLLLSPDGRARILFVNDRCSQLLWPGSLGAKGQALVGRSLWEWMDAQDKAALIGAIGVCIFCKDATRRVQCTFHSLWSPFALQSGGAMQQQGNQGAQHYRQTWQQEREAIRADLTLRSSERGLVIFMRPDKMGEKGM